MRTNVHVVAVGLGALLLVGLAGLGGAVPIGPDGTSPAPAGHSAADVAPVTAGDGQVAEDGWRGGDGWKGDDGCLGNGAPAPAPARRAPGFHGHGASADGWNDGDGWRGENGWRPPGECDGDARGPGHDGDARGPGRDGGGRDDGGSNDGGSDDGGSDGGAGDDSGGLPGRTDVDDGTDDGPGADERAGQRTWGPFPGPDLDRLEAAAPDDPSVGGGDDESSSPPEDSQPGFGLAGALLAVLLGGLGGARFLAP